MFPFFSILCLISSSYPSEAAPVFFEEDSFFQAVTAYQGVEICHEVILTWNSLKIGHGHGSLISA